MGIDGGEVVAGRELQVTSFQSPVSSHQFIRSVG